MIINFNIYGINRAKNFVFLGFLGVFWFFLGFLSLLDSFLGGFCAQTDDVVDHVNHKGVVESFVFVENCVERTIHTGKSTRNQRELDFCGVFWDNVEFLG